MKSQIHEMKFTNTKKHQNGVPSSLISKIKKMSKGKKETLVFLVDDDPIYLKVLEAEFNDKTDYEIKTFASGEECLKNIDQKPDIIFLDYYLNALNPNAHTGLQILDKVRAINPSIQCVILSSQESMEVAINCMKHEAFDYIIKSETAFMRAQKAITVLFYQNQLESDTRFYKTSSIFLITIIVLFSIGAFLIPVFFPGWMH